MKRYLLSIYQPDGPPPGPDVLGPIMRDVDALRVEMTSADVLVFNGGLHPPASATVVSGNEGEVVVTDGPYLEGKEHIGGFWVIRAPELDSALEWAQKATRATTLPIEVRPFFDEAGSEA